MSTPNVVYTIILCALSTMGCGPTIIIYDDTIGDGVTGSDDTEASGGGMTPADVGSEGDGDGDTTTGDGDLGDGDGDPAGPGCDAGFGVLWCPCYDGDLDGDGVATPGGECFLGLTCDAGICLPDG